MFTTTPGRGHAQPMFPLARALADAGQEVLWAAADEACSRLRQEGFDAVAAGPGAAPLDGFLAEVAELPPAERPNVMFASIFGPARAEPMLADLLPLVEDWRPQLMICEQAELAGPIAAALAGIPNITHAFGRLLPAPRVAGAGEAMAGLWHAKGLDPRPYAGAYDHLYLDVYPPSLQSSDAGHLGATQLVRPAEPLARTESEEPLVYITFGTVFNADLQLFADAVEAARDLPVRVVATLGPGHEPGALGDQPDNVRVAEFIPQEELLAECAAVISHGGSGTFLGALAAGVPQLVVPLAADQFLNAEAAEAGGVGLALRPDQVSVDSLRDSLASILGDPGMRKAAARVSREIAAMPAPATVAGALARRFG